MVRISDRMVQPASAESTASSVTPCARSRCVACHRSRPETNTRFILDYPALGGGDDGLRMAIDSDSDLPPVPLTLVSSILVDDIRWTGTRTAYTEIPLMDAFGQDALALADAAGRPLEETIGSYAKAIVDRLRIAADPLAAVIPYRMKRSPSSTPC